MNLKVNENGDYIDINIGEPRTHEGVLESADIRIESRNFLWRGALREIKGGDCGARWPARWICCNQAVRLSALKIVAETLGCNFSQSGDALKMIDMWSAQCGECFKWRIIPTVEEYEEIRSKFIEDPFICSKKAGVSCDDPADIEYDNSRTWLMDKPNLPKSPVGFKRRVVVRKDFSRLDCYYDAPNGRVLRASTQVGKFLSDHPEYKNVSASDFSFTGSKIMEDTLPPPPSLAKKV